MMGTPTLNNAIPDNEITVFIILHVAEKMLKESPVGLGLGALEDDPPELEPAAVP